MNFLISALQYILNQLGSAIFLPIVMIILGLAVGMKFKRALIAGLTLGIAFTGMGVVLGFMFGAIGPVAEKFVTNTGITLTAVDVGWSPMAAIAWAWPYALLMFPFQLGINFILLAFNKTNVLNVDLWNVWGKIFTATMVAALSGSVALGFVAAGIQVVLELITAQATQKTIQEVTGIPGITCTHYMVLESILMNPVNKLLDMIPALKNSTLDAAKLKEKIGIFGENSVMGFIVGSLIAVAAGYGLADVLNTGMKVATSLILFPMVAKLFMQALAPIADAAGTFMKTKFKDREIYIGLDWPFMAGRPEIWVVAIILVPIELVLAVLMNKLGMANVLPLAGIVNIIVVVPALIITKGNLIKMLILSVIFTPVYLFVSSAFAPATTALAKSVNISGIEIGANQLITYFGVEAPEFRWAIAKALSGDVIGIVSFVAFAALFVMFIKDMKKRDALQ